MSHQTCLPPQNEGVLVGRSTMIEGRNQLMGTLEGRRLYWIIQYNWLSHYNEAL
jgi:hypothetical protein